MVILGMMTTDFIAVYFPVDSTRYNRFCYRGLAVYTQLYTDQEIFHITPYSYAYQVNISAI